MSALSSKQFVTKRDGTLEPLDDGKIRSRVQKLFQDVQQYYQNERKTTLDIDFQLLNQIVGSGIQSLRPNIPTSELDELTASRCGHERWHDSASILGGCILASNLEKNILTGPGYTDPETKVFYNGLHIKGYAHRARHYFNKHTQKACPLISEELYDTIMKHGDAIEAHMDLRRNWLFTYNAMTKFIKGQYLLSEYKYIKDQKTGKTIRAKGPPIETPQHLYMRVALFLFPDNLEDAFKLYDLMSLHYATMATPTLFNAGTPKPQCASCFLVSTKGDDLNDIYDVIKQVAMISKASGGIGLHVHNIRCAGSHIASTNGTSNGLVPMLQVVQSTARYVDQGGNKRKGSVAVYLEPWHPDFEEVLMARREKGTTDQEGAAFFLPNLFIGIWVPDLFMERMKEEFNKDQDDPNYQPVMWSFFDPNTAPGLADVYGQEFNELYHRYESEQRMVDQKPIREVVTHIVSTQLEAGGIYWLFKDHCNRKSNQKNLGTIKSSNLCTEIIEYSSPEETAVCNLASISLSALVKTGGADASSSFDFDLLQGITRFLTRCLNKVIDKNCYPIPEAQRSNLRHRPIGIGVQGLADCFTLMGYAYDDEHAKHLNRDIFETLYFAAVSESNQLAMEDGHYPSMKENGGAPIWHGEFQFDLWKRDAGALAQPNPKLGFDWESLRQNCKAYGVRNSLLVAPMPTTSTAIFLDNTEMFEPYFLTFMDRRNKEGDQVYYNKHLIRKLKEAGLWDEAGHMKALLTSNPYSIQHLSDIPYDIRRLFKTVSDIKLKTQADMARDRGLFIDQSQSFNLHFQSGEVEKNMVPFILYAWKIGLKTGAYYTRVIDRKQQTDLSKAMFASDTQLEKRSKFAAPAPGEACESCSA